MDLKNSMLLANMMSNNQGIQFKTHIYATGNAFIDTGVRSDITAIKIKGEWRVSSYSSSTEIYYFGNLIRQSIAGGTYTTGVVGFGRKESDGVVTELDSYSVTSGTTDRKYVYNSSGGSSDISSPKFNLGQSKLFFGGNRSFYILAARVDTHVRYSNDTFAIETVKFYNGSQLVNEFRPAIVNDECGMYDTVTGIFHRNANSTGSLICENRGAGNNIIDFNVVGTLTNNNGVVSGFSSSNYLQSTTSVFLGNEFEFYTVFTTDVLTSDNEIVMGGKTNQYINYGHEYGNDRHQLQYNVGNGSSWWASGTAQTFGANAIQSNTKYYNRLTFDGSVYKAFLSTDGINWLQDWSFSKNELVPPFTLLYGVSRAISVPWKGSIDIDNSYLKIEGIKYAFRII